MINALKISAISCLFLAAFAFNASAAEVRSGISTRETYVGMPVTFQVQIANATDFDPPTLPEISGLRIESVGQPSRSTQTTIINGSMSTRSSVTYSFAVTPLETGSFRIPPISVRADGETLETRPFEFVASKSETGDLLFVEVAGKEKQIYVGQALDLQLKIWVRPYRDKEHGITLSEGDMWQLIAERTSWGPFQERIEQFAANNQRPVGTEVLRKDRDGANHSYYLYEIDATIYPKKPGRIDANDVQVVALYPTAIGQSRDPFGGMFEEMGFPGHRSPFARRLAIESVRPIVAEGKVEPIEVQEIPIADRPVDYRGAVGKYQIVTGAEPTDLKAGDPIKLIVGIAGTGPMDLVQAPPLAELLELTKDFKVPNEPLAGYVEGARKVFSTTIRPRKDGITEIPPIPFTYFDPEVGKFVTAHSEPISIHVSPADTLALDAVVGRSKAGAHANDRFAADASAARPVLINFTSEDLLTNQSSPASITPPLLAAIVLPPAMVLGLLLLRGRSGMASIAGRFRSARRQFQAEIESATRPGEIEAALRKFLAKRFGLHTTANATSIVGALRAAGYRNLAVRCERLLQQCDVHGSVGFGAMPSVDELKQRSLQIFADLETQRRPAVGHVVRNARQIRVTTPTIVVAVALFTAIPSVHAADISTTLTPAQRRTLLTEATDCYNAALSTVGNDSAEAKEAFADAARKYQLLVDSGVHNNRLYFNLGNAYLESGEIGRAIANYRRSLALDPTNRAARNNLELAENAITGKADDTHANNRSFTNHLANTNDWLNSVIGPRTILTVTIGAWFAFWVALGLRLAEIRFPWKSVALAALVLTAITTTSCMLTLRSLARPTAVVVSSAASLRTGDGENFPTVIGTVLAEGQSVGYLRRRRDWTQVRTTTGHSGWLPNSAVEVL